ncbi:uncharacterized protein LOC118194703 [Stegodyphus dumicola]|uniref:uncharacterized protein LOC118194703 n=1 Tax=Stegodyphus dumicola TaxID=202533 RepID=UPI0015A81877|nr:uncharacterized protein LOC118194703 [Stegodyphus dumicola]
MGSDLRFQFKVDFQAEVRTIEWKAKRINRRASLDGWGPWGEWICTKSCGGGRGMRKHDCIDPGPGKCQGRWSQMDNCNTQPCPKPVEKPSWSEWMPWDCPVSCGGGEGTRSRICIDPDICKGPSEEKGRCNTKPCPSIKENVPQNLKESALQRVISMHKNFQLQKGESVTLPCLGNLQGRFYSEFPDLKLSWMLNNQNFQLDKSRMIKDEGSGDIKISEISPKENGIFMCVVQLAGGDRLPTSFVSVAVQNDEPDIKVPKGESFTLVCNSKPFEMIPTPMSQHWYHNSTLFKEYKNAKFEKVDELDFDTSKYNDSGIWLCKVIDNTDKTRSMREWATNVIRVKVGPPLPAWRKALPYILGITIPLVLIAIVSFIFYKRVMKKRKLELEDEEKLISEAKSKRGIKKSRISPEKKSKIPTKKKLEDSKKKGKTVDLKKKTQKDDFKKITEKEDAKRKAKKGEPKRKVKDSDKQASKKEFQKVRKSSPKSSQLKDKGKNKKEGTRKKADPTKKSEKEASTKHIEKSDLKKKNKTKKMVKKKRKEEDYRREKDKEKGSHISSRKENIKKSKDIASATKKRVRKK